MCISTLFYCQLQHEITDIWERYISRPLWSASFTTLHKMSKVNNQPFLHLFVFITNRNSWFLLRAISKELFYFDIIMQSKRGCKNSTERSCEPFTQFSLMAICSITTVQYHSQARDAGKMCMYSSMPCYLGLPDLANKNSDTQLSFLSISISHSIFGTSL